MNKYVFNTTVSFQATETYNIPYQPTFCWGDGSALDFDSPAAGVTTTPDQFTLSPDITTPSSDGRTQVKSRKSHIGKTGGEAKSMTSTPIPASAATVWKQFCARLKHEVGADIYSSWFERMELESETSSSVIVSVPTRFLRQWIAGHYIAILNACWEAETGVSKQIEVTVRTALRKKQRGTAVGTTSNRPNVTPTGDARQQSDPKVLSGARPHGYAPPATPAHITGSNVYGSPLDPRQTFATFCEGRSNQLALTASRHVASAGANDFVTFNPLYIHSTVGLGKTHLLNAIAHEANATNPSRNVVSLTAEFFMSAYVSAIQSKTATSFKQRLRDVDLLLIDDVQFLRGPQVQQEFCHLLNALIDAKKQVVIVADRAPVELDMFDERMRSRLAGGLLVDIDFPEEALRTRIVQSRIDLARMTNPDFNIPAEVVAYIVDSITGSGRELDGAINRLVAQSQINGAAINLELAEQALRDLIRNAEPKKVKIEDIQRVVSKHFNVTKSDLLSARRNRTIVRPRQIAMFLSKTLTPRSLPEIGRRFGGRDHTTVLHAVRKIEELTNVDEALGQEIELLKQMLDS